MKHILNAWNIIKLLFLISAALIEPITHFVQAKNSIDQATHLFNKANP
ncbi:MAG: hypothetical protein BWY54_00341 [Candidatus Dependentiae bacterium ADurb.Bin331]|nr:MAG: hypothetical protein BWY54_00341 [Candidatus Dependentiae bacterium ADurb.Bin331]